MVDRGGPIVFFLAALVLGRLMEPAIARSAPVPPGAGATPVSFHATATSVAVSV